MLPGELSKILAGVDRTVATLENKHGGSGGVSGSINSSSAASKALKSSAGATAGKSSRGGESGSNNTHNTKAVGGITREEAREHLEGVAVLKDWSALRSLG